jgi:hypothetical protein
MGAHWAGVVDSLVQVGLLEFNFAEREVLPWKLYLQVFLPGPSVVLDDLGDEPLRYGVGLRQRVRSASP